MTPCHRTLPDSVTSLLLLRFLFLERVAGNTVERIKLPCKLACVNLYWYNPTVQARINNKDAFCIFGLPTKLTVHSLLYMSSEQRLGNLCKGRGHCLWRTSTLCGSEPFAACWFFICFPSAGIPLPSLFASAAHSSSLPNSSDGISYQTVRSYQKSI
jgi:hypothetical protein